MIKTIRIIACTVMLCLSAATAKADALLDLVRQLNNFKPQATSAQATTTPPWWCSTTPPLP